ncbi:MAG: hypothetical protein ACI8XU_001375 [Kiritimatiellia bacterium]|jgi:uncharacterized protein (DUF1330 family)
MNAYLVLDLTIHDMESFAEYVEKIPAVISKHDGSYAVQGQIPTVLEGDWKPDRLVVIEFPSRDNAKAFLADPEAQTLFAIRHQATTSKLLLVDGTE